MFLGSTEAALMGNFTPISRWPAKRAMKTACVHNCALRAPLCIQGDVMAHFAGRREIGVKFPMRAASVDPKSTQHTPVTINPSVQTIEGATSSELPDRSPRSLSSASSAACKTCQRHFFRTQKLVLIHEIWPNLDPRTFAQFQG